MKLAALLLLWLALVFAAIVFAEHFGALNPVVFWIGLALLFLTLSLLGWTAGALGHAPRKAPEPPHMENAITGPQLEVYAAAVAPYLALTGWKMKGPVSEFEGRLKTPPAAALAGLTAEFQSRDQSPFLLEGDGDEVRLILIPGSAHPVRRVRPRWWLHGTLFFLTFLTTTWVGAWQRGINLWQTPQHIARGLPYSVGLLLILGAHELGHYFAARRHRVDVSPPYFVPVPFALGTFGAFINMRGIAENRRAVFDVAVAGPLAGLVFALPALWIGLGRSIVIPGNVPLGLASTGVELHASLLLTLLAKAALGPILAGSHGLILHPLAFAGWIGLLVTALNLLPIGQLDGGHMAHALLGSRRGHAVSVVALSVLFLLSFFASPSLIAWAFVVYFLAGTRDLPPRDDITPLNPARKLLGAFAFALLVAIMLPVPHELYHAVDAHGFYF